MLLYQVGNLLESIETFKLDGIVNAANGIGPMGAGIAGAIKKYGGDEIQEDAFRVCKKYDPQEGGAYRTISGLLKQQGIKYIIHAVTMKQPGGETSIEICRKAFKSAIRLAERNGIKKLGCTALGTGIGGLDSKEIARKMFLVAEKEKNIDIFFIDFNKSFINEISYLNEISLPNSIRTTRTRKC